jgi:deoxyribodipyrimidine photolyase-related protein
MLFETKYLPNNTKVSSVQLVEEPIYFGYRSEFLNFNKLKLLFHRATMKKYYNYLVSRGYSVKYVNFNKKYDAQGATTFDVNDHELFDRLKPFNITYLPNPNFMVSIQTLEQYTGAPFHKAFFDFIKEETGILVGTPSYDSANRRRIPTGKQIPRIASKTYKHNLESEKRYINKWFPDNLGDINNLIFPITHRDSKLWFKRFLNERLKHFGTYQDAISFDNPFLFHSVISPMLNVGLLMPDYVINEVLKQKVPMNSKEGFIRQVLGWREYQRYCYLFYAEKITKNHLTHRKQLSEAWYYGTTGIEPVDNAIITAFKYGYLHHIARLMIMANFMNLCYISPHDMYKWFMEFSVDSYDWVMLQNVYSMGSWADGGLTMRKPYLSSSNYILKMSNFKRDEWADIWDALFYAFILKHKKKLSKTPYIRNLSHWNKKTKSEKDEIIKLANRFLRQL